MSWSSLPLRDWKSRSDRPGGRLRRPALCRIVGVDSRRCLWIPVRQGDMRPYSISRTVHIAAIALPAVAPFASVRGQSAGALNPTATARIDSVALAELASTGTPGASLVMVQGDRVVYAKGYGVANVETRESVAPGMIFRLGSTTKMMTSLAALALVSRGMVDLDRPIGEYAPAIASPRLRTVTLRQLLTHTSGLLDYTSMSGPHDDDAMNAFVPTLTDTAFFTQPGDIMSYSNLGYVVAGYVLSIVSKKPYAEVMHDEVFGPLGMTHSTVRPIEAMTFPLAQGHQRSAGNTMQIARPAPDDSRYWPAGSAFTTGPDFARLAIAMMNDGREDGKQVIPAAVVRSWRTPFVSLPGDTSANPGRYGFGLETRVLHGDTVIEHSGSRAGYGSMFRAIPSRRIAIIVLGNQSGIALRRTLDAATAALDPDLRSEPPSRPAPTTVDASAQSQLVGSYRNGRTTGIDIFVKDGQVQARSLTSAGDAATGVPLQRIGTSWFVAGNTRFAIVTGADGKTRYAVVGVRAMRKQG
jgi:CubicO group peptidase (beta-lactamase class C family)